MNIVLIQLLRPAKSYLSYFEPIYHTMGIGYLRLAMDGHGMIGLFDPEPWIWTNQ